MHSFCGMQSGDNNEMKKICFACIKSDDNKEDDEIEESEDDFQPNCVVCRQPIANGEAWDCAKCGQKMHEPGKQSKRNRKACTKGRKNSSPWCRKCDEEFERKGKEARKQREKEQKATVNKRKAAKATDGAATVSDGSRQPRKKRSTK